MLPLTWPLFLREVSFPLNILTPILCLGQSVCSGPLPEGNRVQEETDSTLSIQLSQVWKVNFHSVLGCPQDARDGSIGLFLELGKPLVLEWGVLMAVTGWSRMYDHFAFCSHICVSSSRAALQRKAWSCATEGPAPASYKPWQGKQWDRGHWLRYTASSTLPRMGVLSSLPPSSLL